MNDYIITIIQPDGSELKVSTDMIEEDVIRHRCGLESRDDDKDSN